MAKSEAYSLILQAIDQLLDAAEDDLAREALDPLAALRTRCTTLTVALRVTLLALSCHGQKETFIKEIAQNLNTFVQLKEVWNQNERQEDGQEETG